MTTNVQPTVLDPESIAAGAARILARMVGRDAAELTKDTRLFADLGLDSTNALELLMLVEDELGIAIDPDTLEHQHLESVGSLVEYLAQQVDR